MRAISAFLKLVQPLWGLVVKAADNDHQNLAGSEYWRFTDEPGLAARWGARARAAMHSLRTYKLGRSAYLRATGRPTLDRYFTAPAAMPLMM